MSLSNSWAQSVRKTLPATIAPGKPFHVTLDNSDGRQQTLTGAETTHHTNGTVFQISNRESEQSVSSSTTATEEKLCMKDEDNLEYGTYKIPKRVNPPAVPEFQDKSQSDLLDWCLARDIAWVTTGALGTAFKTEKDTETQDYMYNGSWTTFMKSVTDFDTQKACLEYLEVVPFPPNDSVCKYYLDLMVDMAQDAGVDCIFAHSDEEIFSKMVLIQWLHQGKYDKVINLMGGFHTFLVNLKIQKVWSPRIAGLVGVFRGHC